MAGRLRTDIIGKRFTRLVVVDFSHMHGKKSYWICECDCGNTHVVRRDCLTGKQVQSCGCLNTESRPNQITHGGSRTPLYRIWASMIQRCENPNNTGYKDYGQRGISVCKDWHDFGIFQNWSKNNGYKRGLELDRIDNDGHYEPDNCRWVTRRMQTLNTRRTHWVTRNGVTKPLIEWIKESGLPRNTVYSRILTLGWDYEKALTTPVKRVETISKEST